jgi:NADH-quinone oxidoreductase subunit A
MDQYLPIVVMLILATGFAAMSFLASRLLGPRKPTTAKLAPYECGIVPSRDPAQRFPVRFYLVAMIFIIFDIEIVFIYPWAVIYRQLDTFGLSEMVVFAVAVFVSFLYLISNGALDWGPPQRLARRLATTSDRTSTSTIRRVPRPGAQATLSEGEYGAASGSEPGSVPGETGPAEPGPGEHAPATVGVGAQQTS